MSETPGQAAYEAYVRAVGLDPADWPFEACVGDMGREGWEDVAKAGYEAIAAQEPKAAPELAAAMRETRLIRERVTAVATGLEDRARINHPSKVSQICTDIAASLRRALEGK